MSTRPITRAYFALATGAMFAAPAAFAQAPAPATNQQALHVAGLAATCANCHGTQGKTVEGSPLPRLAGMPRDQMVQQLAAFRAGTRPATVMHQIVKGFSDAQVAQIADYFAAQK